MANTFMTNVPDAFTLEYLGQELTQAFQQKGYIVTTALSGTDNLRVRLEKKLWRDQFTHGARERDYRKLLTPKQYARR